MHETQCTINDWAPSLQFDDMCNFECWFKEKRLACMEDIILNYSWLMKLDLYVESISHVLFNISYSLHLPIHIILTNTFQTIAAHYIIRKPCFSVNHNRWWSKQNCIQWENTAHSCWLSFPSASVQTLIAYCCNAISMAHFFSFWPVVMYRPW